MPLRTTTSIPNVPIQLFPPSARSHSQQLVRCDQSDRLQAHTSDVFHHFLFLCSSITAWAEDLRHTARRSPALPQFWHVGISWRHLFSSCFPGCRLSGLGAVFLSPPAFLPAIRCLAGVLRTSTPSTLSTLPAPLMSFVAASQTPSPHTALVFIGCCVCSQSCGVCGVRSLR